MFVDALMIRMILLPVTLRLTGHGAWHRPRWLDKVLPVVDLEGVENADTEPTDVTAVAVRTEELVTR